MKVDLQALRREGRTPAVPCELMLADDRCLRIVQWLRILPGKRLVGRAELDGQVVLAKVFIARASQRHWQREAQGLQALATAKLSTPEVILSQALPGGGHLLCTRFLEGSLTLAEVWDGLAEQSPASTAAVDLLSQALRAIAEMHQAGLTQADLHLGNFLQQSDRLFLIDGDAVQTVCPSQPLDAVDAERNLAVFFAQLDSDWDTQIERLLVEYLSVNAARALNPDRLSALIDKHRQHRLEDWLAKALRDCSAFLARRNWWRFSVAVRDQSVDLAPLLADPDAPFASKPSLKDGGSSSVTRLQMAGRSVVIKRYNIKGLGHWLSRFWRPSRAWHAWLAGQRLRFLGIATPAPLAMIESRFGPLRRRAWLLNEFCPGQDLRSLFDPTGQTLPPDEQLQALLRCFQQLAQARISHGDCKATNLLWHEGQIWLIDLDAMQTHSTDASWQRAWSKDRARLIRNWPEDSPLAGWLATNLLH